MIKVGIIGATGYAGAELVRIIIGHPETELTAISSVSFEGKKLSEVYPSYRSLCDMECQNAETVVDKSDIIFAALPHGLSQELGAECINKGKAFIDLGADFRLESESEYKEWYNGEFINKDLHEQAVYGLPELFRDKIKGKKLIANPGCYTTGAPLALAPAVKNDIVKTEHIIIDSKSGVTGAGRGLSQTSHFPELNEAFHPYKVASHRHTPEIEQTLSKLADKKVKITFVPHLLPVNRGIISTCYAQLKENITKEQVRTIYKEFYKNEYFIRLLDDGQVADIHNIKYSNFCDISIHIDERTNMLIAVSAIDNMVKGAAGQAVQNMNIIFGLDEKTGLMLVPPAF